MLRAAAILLLSAMQCAMASWLRVGVFDDTNSNQSRPTVRLSLPDHSWTWEGRLAPAAGMSAGLLISEPVWIPEGAQSAVVAQLLGEDDAHSEVSCLLPTESSQWFLDFSPQCRLKDKEPSALSSGSEPRISPNPFNLTTRISLTLAERTEADLRIVDILGRTAQVVHAGSLESGAHSWTLDARSLASGTYFLSYRLSPGSSGATRLLLLK